MGNVGTWLYRLWLPAISVDWALGRLTSLAWLAGVAGWVARGARDWCDR